MRSASTTGATVALLAALLAGCTSTDQGGNPPDQPPATTGPSPTVATTDSPPTVAPSGTPTAGGVAPRVTLRRSGGFAGRGDAVTVEPDGRWTAVDRAGSRRTGQLDTADLGRLGGLVADPRLAAEARLTASPSGCADAFSYRLTVGAIETGYVDCPGEATPPPATRALVELILRATD
ncbi:protealysin inhibitor emfourin [Micromonospora sp. NPDC000663]|uniref:protealysin inhibitor emfourin n=1 Tax=Micromonospora sp. NPDC000663 TaxID=3364218 RepID=UPI0036BA3763